VVHGFQLGNPLKDVILDVCCELTLGYDLQGVEVLLYGLIQGLRVDHDIAVLSVFKRDNFKVQFLPLLANALENRLILGFSIGMVYDVMDLLLVVLNIIFTQIYDGELGLRLEMGRLNQIKDLHPMPVV
jgi:hypothetical protein